MPLLLLNNGRGTMKPVTIEPRGRKLSLRFSQDPGLLDEVKVMRGAEFVGGAWEVTDCRRNKMQIEALMGEVPPEHRRYASPERVSVIPSRKIMAHQQAMLDHAATFRCVLWASEQGTGKTLSAIELMEWASGRGFTDWWYVAPNNVTRSARLELEKWGCRVRPRFVAHHLLHQALEARYRCRSCAAEWPDSRTRKQNSGAIRCPSCHAETERHQSLWKRLPDQPAPHGVILDESSFFKNGGAQKSEAAQRLADSVRQERDGFVIEMSGTPAPLEPTDMHSQMEIAAPGWLRESTETHLRRRLAVFSEGPFPDVVGWRQDEVEKLYARCQPVLQVHLAKDCLDLPELRRETVRLEPGEDLLRAARLIAQTAGGGAAALTRLRQLSDGFLYAGTGECPACAGIGTVEQEACAKCLGVGFAQVDSVTRCPTPKEGALKEWLGRAEECGRVVVYAGFHESVDRCAELCREAGWSVGKCDGRGWVVDPELGYPEQALREMDPLTRTKLPRAALVCHPASGGYGLNCAAARINIFWSNDFNAASRWQAEKRSHRNGQVHGVTIVDLINLGTDLLVIKNLDGKRVLQSVTLGEVVDALEWKAVAA